MGGQQIVKDYTVQQSEDCLVFNNACTVTAKGNTKYYYRVLQQDLDAKFTYSKTVILQSSSAIALALYPNPAKDKLYVDGIAGYSILQLADINGKMMQQQNIAAGLKYIDISHLGPGMYLLTASGGKETKTLIFVKQ